MKNNYNTELLKSALRASINEDYNTISEDSAYTPSEKQTNTIETILNNPAEYKNKNNKALKLTLIITAILLLLIGCTMTIKELRDPVVKFFIRAFTNYSYMYTINNEETPKNGKLENVYIPKYIPDEYEFSSIDESEGLFNAIWKTIDGSYLQYNQMYNYNTSTIIDTENSISSTIEINNGVFGIYYFNNYDSCLIWNEGPYVFTIISSGSLEANRLIAIAKSLEQYK